MKKDVQTPQEIRQQIWMELGRASQDRHHAWRTPVLATVGVDGAVNIGERGCCQTPGNGLHPEIALIGHYFPGNKSPSNPMIGKKFNLMTGRPI